ncbi:two-component sensor histidine kinase [Priestia megaterium]|jgi:signal transduction histidine kinase|uniref:HAMP domain-containing sensor histidine kinase n=1 Tax=Priestia TaxID=2800373 RepID=UPI00094D79B9|nr:MULTISPECIES: HAMP domain-containing sensor histidine kinase [Priestia]MBY0091796.1 HAMP domain-containing histidine kinase [Priestia aryabhattai]MBY0104444.1 HAMP domain-containing histidine kinase [Priestia aryabhattai]MCM3307911.1 HAMP domain-containing histidine kinase [Priestia megaterium]OLO27975.1 two-component sensor histidine kinase [Priestia megaterium]
MKLQTKIILTSTALLFILLVIANSSVYFIFKKTMEDNAIERLQAETSNVTNGLKQTSSTVKQANLLRAYLPPNGMIRILPKSGSPLVVSVTDQTKELQDLPYSYYSNEQTTIKEDDGHLYAISHTPVIWTNGEVVSLEVTEQIEDVEQSLQTLKFILLIASLVILIPTIFAGRLLSKIILRPIKSLIHTMEEIQVSRTFKKIDLSSSSKDELDQMANTFNNMMDLLEENYKKQEQFVSDASHELKTPLTVVESYANMLKRWGMKRPDILEEAIEAIHSESLRMKQLTSQMLVLAKDESQWELHMEHVDAAAVCTQTIKHLEQAFERTIYLNIKTDHPVVTADEKRLKQLLYILLDNAIKYSEKAVEVTIARNESFMITVTDQGIGIPKEDLSNVYERFFRVDKARNRETGGSGLGLSIARKIVEAHSGRIEINSQEGKGTSVTVCFPL